MKLDGWYPALVAYIDGLEREPFQPGTHDCALFVAGALEVQCGVDPAAKWRGKYKTIAAGMKLMQRDGFSDHIAFVEACFDEIPASRACSGDIALVETGGQFSLGIVVKAAIYLVIETGLGVLPLQAAQRAWSSQATIKQMEV